MKKKIEFVYIIVLSIVFIGVEMGTLSIFIMKCFGGAKDIWWIQLWFMFIIPFWIYAKMGSAIED